MATRLEETSPALGQVRDPPRDGTRIIGWYGERPIIVWWREGYDYARPPEWNRALGRYTRPRCEYWTDGYYRHPEPDAWQSIPEPPAA